GTTTSTTFTSTLTGGTACSVVFTAPTSGRVLLINGCQISNSGNNTSTCAAEVREGDSVGVGTIVSVASTLRAGRNGNANPVLGSFADVIGGLTAGGSYNAQQMFAVASGTGTFSNKTLIVVPLP